MDLEWLEESTEYEKEHDDNEVPKSLLNDYQKTEEIVVSIYEKIRDYLHKENERFLPRQFYDSLDLHKFSI